MPPLCNDLDIPNKFIRILIIFEYKINFKHAIFSLFFLKFFAYPFFLHYQVQEKTAKNLILATNDVQHYNNWNFIYSCYTQTFETSAWLSRHSGSAIGPVGQYEFPNSFSAGQEHPFRQFVWQGQLNSISTAFSLQASSQRASPASGSHASRPN